MPHITARHQIVFPDIPECRQEPTLCRIKHKVIEELADACRELIDIELLRIQHRDAVGIFIKELLCTLIVGTISAITHKQNEGSSSVHNLKRPMEELAGIDEGRMDPLHLHQAANGETIADTQGRAASKRYDNLIVLVRTGKLLRAGLDITNDLIHNVLQHIKRRVSVIQILIAIESREDLKGELENRSGVALHIFSLGIKDCVKGDVVISNLAHIGIGIMAIGNRNRPGILRDLGRHHGLGHPERAVVCGRFYRRL